ncbi:SapC family protein [Halomonadaceae bacterium KBTZ08]
MAHYVPLSKTTHRQSGLVASGYAFALEQAVVPVVADELPQVLPTMAAGFVRAADNTSFELVALQSLEAGVNVYVHTNGQWIGGYRPAWYRAHPFRLMKDAQSDRDVVCVDEASPCFEPEAGDSAVRLFDDSGEPTERTNRTVRFLEQYQKSARATGVLVGQLEKAGLIVPWQVTARNPNTGKAQPVKGLYHIDEGGLRALDPESQAELGRSGALSVAYAQLFSEHRLKGLERLYQLRQKANQRSRATEDVDIESLFADDDDLTFDV